MTHTQTEVSLHFHSLNNEVLLIELDVSIGVFSKSLRLWVQWISHLVPELNIFSSLKNTPY